MSELTEAKIEELRGMLDDRREALSDLSRWPTHEHEAAHSQSLDRLCIAAVNALPALLDLAASSLARGGECEPAGASEELCRRLEMRQGNYDEGILVAPADHDALEAAALIRRLEREGSQWQERESETQEELQAIGEEFGAYGGEPRTDAMRRLLTETTARATTAEAEAESWKSQFHSAAEAASMYVEFYEQHHADFDPAGNYIPHSQIDGDLRAAKAEAERLRAERDELREKVERLEGERNALSAEMDQATGRIDDIGAEAKALRSENAALQEAVFRAEHRELVNAANWHKAAEDAKSGKWANLLARLEGMTAEERRAKVVLSMDKQREIRRARTALEGKTDGK